MLAILPAGIALAAKPSYEYFDPAAAADIESIAALIIPATDTLGAREAGVIHFIDHALATVDRDQRAVYRAGLADLNVRVKARHPAAASFSKLDKSSQTQLIHDIENTPFFEHVRTHTILGFFGDPSYGGNRNEAGWKLIGFEGAHAYQPPFGVYDGRPR